MSERKEKRERMIRRRESIKRLAANVLGALVLGTFGTLIFCLIFGVFREGAILL